jgi:thiamine-phosphate pyrophosphorylase
VNLLRYYITNRHALGGKAELLANIGRVLKTGIDYLQIREKDLTARELLELTRAVLEMAVGTKTLVLVNSRADLALAAGAHGVHLPSDSIAPWLLRPFVPAAFSIAVSCHSVDEVQRAEREGANFVVFGPVFESPEKGRAMGLGSLSEAAGCVQIPVLALGGITLENQAQCMAAGAAGIAGISLFQV